MIKKTFAIIALMALPAMASTSLANTLEQVKAKDVLTLGVSEGVSGFSATDDKGVLTGFDGRDGKRMNSVSFSV